jgi:hypothetical protein
MDGCATFVMDMSRTCHRIFSRCIIHALFMEQLAEALARDVTKNTRGDVFRCGLDAREPASSVVGLRYGQLVRGAFVVVAGGSVA